MKNIFKYLLIIAFASISFGAMAQVQDVELNSLRRYAVGTDKTNPVDVATSDFYWEVTTKAGVAAKAGVDYQAYASEADGKAKTNPITINANTAHRNVIYIEWLGTPNTELVVKVIEKDKVTKCYDPALNAFAQDVKIIPNNFEIFVAWDKVSSNTTNNGTVGLECAIDGDNVVGFKVTRKGGKAMADWGFKYQYKLDGADWSDVSVLETIVGNGTVANDEKVIVIDKTMLLTKDKLIGSGKFTVYFRVVYAHDYYDTPAKNITETQIDKTMAYDPDTTNPKAMVDINKIPAGQGLHLD